MAGINWSNVTTFEQMLTSANTSASGFWLGVLVMITAVILITLMPYGVIVSLLASTFLGFIIGLFLAYLGLVAWTWVLMILGILIATILYIIIWGKGN